MTRRIPSPFLLAALLFAAADHAGAKPLGGRTDVEFCAMPAEREGRYPIALPTYAGQVRQLHLLNDRWLVVGIYDLPELAAHIDKLSEGKLEEANRQWREGQEKGQPHWGAWVTIPKILKEFTVRAREELGERKLEEPAAYAIISTDDPAYKTARRPARATRTLISLGGNRLPGMHEVDYGHYGILELPAPLQPGRSYTVRVIGRGEVTFTYDENRMVSRAIKVNQAGYRPDAPRKLAYLGAFACELGAVPFDHAKEFSVVDARTGKAVFAGPVRLIERNPRFAPKNAEQDAATRPFMYGEDVYELDLTGLKDEGNFFITIPGVGRSWPFRHARDAYGEAFYIAARGFYHQRAATALETPYTVWTRPKSTMHDTIYEAGYLAFPQQTGGPKDLPIFDAVGGTMDLTRFTTNVIGGWYDAADWDRNQAHYVAAFDMMWAYEHAPARFTDGQLNLPESGDGIPDILNEVQWGLECWRRSQDERGGVSGFIEANTHPGYDDPKHPYAFSMRTRWSSLIYAAAAAQYARLVKPFDAKRSALYRESALRAWAFGADPANSLGRITLHAKTKRGTGEPYTREWEETDKIVAPYRLHAALELNRLTGDPAYLEGIGELAAQGQGPFQWMFSHKDFSGWIYAGLALDREKRLPAEVVQKWREAFIRSADGLVNQMTNVAYRQTWPRSQDYWAGWGASVVVNFNRCLFIAWQLTDDEKYREAILLNTDFMLGANPLGMSWTTGIGYVYPIDIQHANSENDQLMDPVPGITIYGINGGPAMHYRGRELVWESKGPDDKPVSFMKEENKSVPFFRAWSAHPHVNVGQCEFTVHETSAAMLFSTAILLDDGWMPDAALKTRGPRRDDLLFGYWYGP
ncbi:MAG TPA: glycoside hydrolase family 9 protein [Kiritimatiellia bacterium]|nr:glycoside hydrolase family 9 protein [Kiritimatiellia bacterium]